MILLKSLIVILILLILAQLYKSYYKSSNTQEGFRQLYQQNELFPVAEGENISNVLESRSSNDILAPNMPLYAPDSIQGYALIENTDDGLATMSASQKAQLKANLQKTGEETATIGQHKRIMNNALDMDKLENQIKELLSLSDQAKQINEDLNI